MSKYEIGKDIKELEHRIQILEEVNFNKLTNKFYAVTAFSGTDFIQADAKGLDNCRHWWWKWNDFIISNSEGRELLNVKGLIVTYTGWLDSDGNKDASVFMGARVEDLAGLNWNFCMNISIQTSEGVFVGIGVTDGSIILKNTSYAVAGHGFPVDQTHADQWYDSIGPGLDLGDGIQYSVNGRSSGIPESCDSVTVSQKRR